MFPLFVSAQQDTSGFGIRFEDGLTWKDILNKAKKEGKYVFIDCFATWCGPCKKMDNEVYTDKKVAEFFNKNFVSVKIQMDKTKGDNENVRKWYFMAADVSKQYGIPFYPTYLFFSPSGKLVFRDGGYKNSSSFIVLGQRAIDPKYQGKYIVYYRELVKYQLGKKDYSMIGYLADTASQLHQDSLAAIIISDYNAYLSSISEDEWMSPPNLNFILKFTKTSKSPFFKFLFEKSNKMELVLQKEGLVQSAVDKIIQKEEIDPIVKPVKGARSTTEVPKVEDEPDWAQLYRKISDKYNHQYAERNILYARTNWYMDHWEWQLAAKYFTLFIKKYSPQYVDGTIGNFLNRCSWNAVFKRSVDKEQISEAINCLKQWISKEQYPLVLDTYANLLYKSGNVQEAILIEEQALRLSPADKNLLKTLDRMKSGKPTWPHCVSNDFFDTGIID
jgi:thioredoxin-related protein